jgi:hypothetical protein
MCTHLQVTSFNWIKNQNLWMYFCSDQYVPHALPISTNYLHYSTKHEAYYYNVTFPYLLPITLTHMPLKQNVSCRNIFIYYTFH